MSPSSLRRCRSALAGAVLAALPGIAWPAAALQQSETVTRTFTLATFEGHRTLVVDNVSGAIEIEAASGDSVELVLKQTYVARDAAGMARARQEVTLEVTAQPGRLELVQGGICRCRGRCGFRADRCRDGDDSAARDFDVRFDWTLRVPRNLDLDVANVNEGAIRITGTSGRLAVSNVNDDITLVSVAGGVEAHTVNGELKVEFESLPTSDCEFGTVNGDIDLAFPKGLGAELSFKTMNGEVYTDFPFTLAKLRPTSSHSQIGGRQHHEVGGTTAAIIGGGGFGLACQTINGDITIRERS